MRRMTGEIGKLSLNGEQIGGFKYWTAMVQKKPPYTRVVASKFWIFKKPETNNITAGFFYDTGDDLKQVLEKEVTIKLPEKYELGTMMVSPLEMVFEDSFNWLS